MFESLYSDHSNPGVSAPGFCFAPGSTDRVTDRVELTTGAWVGVCVSLVGRASLTDAVA